MWRDAILLWVGAAFVTILPLARARGDGCMFAIEEVGKSGKMAASPKQEAVLIQDGPNVRVILRTHFRAGPKELAWVVPVPAKPTDIDKGDEGVFAELEEATAPRFVSVKYGGKPFFLACTCAAGNAGDATPIAASVIVEATGTAGIFEYSVLSARRADKLVGWLNGHRYYVPPGAAAVFARYVRDGWHWLAMRIRPELTDRPTLAPHPVTYSYTADKLVYPLVISRVSADKESEVVLYVLAPERVTCANWSNVTTQQLAGPAGQFHRSTGSPSGTNYEDRFRSETHRVGGRLFVTEFATRVRHLPLLERITGRDPLKDGPHLTRLRAILTPQAMDRDVTIRQIPDAEPVWNEHHIAAATVGSARARIAPPAMMCAAVCVLLLGVRLLGRSPRSRAVGGLCVFVGCVVLTMV